MRLLSQQLRSWFRNLFAIQSPRKGQRRTRERNYRPILDVLEDRLAPAAVPIVMVTAPPTPFIGTSIPLAIAFSNPSASGATNAGFAPWDYAVLPRTGFQGSFPGSTAANAYDGIRFDASVTPTFPRAALTALARRCTASG